MNRKAKRSTETSDFVEQEGEQNTIVECANAELGGPINQAQQVEGQVERMLFEGKPTEPEAEQCEEVVNSLQMFFAVENLPYDMAFEYTGQQLSQDETEEVGSGTVRANGKPGEPIKFTFEVQEFPFTTCNYEAKDEALEIDGKVVNGSEAEQQSQVIFDQEQATAFEEVGGEFGCEDELAIVATFDLKGEQNEEQIDLYIAKEKA